MSHFFFHFFFFQKVTTTHLQQKTTTRTIKSSSAYTLQADNGRRILARHLASSAHISHVQLLRSIKSHDNLYYSRCALLQMHATCQPDDHRVTETSRALALFSRRPHARTHYTRLRRCCCSLSLHADLFAARRARGARGPGVWWG